MMMIVALLLVTARMSIGSAASLASCVAACCCSAADHFQPHTPIATRSTAATTSVTTASCSSCCCYAASLSGVVTAVLFSFFVFPWVAQHTSDVTACCTTKIRHAATRCALLRSMLAKPTCTLAAPLASNVMGQLDMQLATCRCCNCQCLLRIASCCSCC
eukprot:COSAG06_NODE_29087_length_562_cov_3.334773_1_plen_159_part_10